MPAGAATGVTTGAGGTVRDSVKASPHTQAYDTLATAPTIATLVATDNIIDASERATGVAVTGTNEAGTTEVILCSNPTTATSTDTTCPGGTPYTAHSDSRHDLEPYADRSANHRPHSGHRDTDRHRHRCGRQHRRVARPPHQRGRLAHSRDGNGCDAARWPHRKSDRDRSRRAARHGSRGEHRRRAIGYCVQPADGYFSAIRRQRCRALNRLPADHRRADGR